MPTYFSFSYQVIKTISKWTPGFVGVVTATSIGLMKIGLLNTPPFVAQYLLFSVTGELPILLQNILNVILPMAAWGSITGVATYGVNAMLFSGYKEKVADDAIKQTNNLAKKNKKLKKQHDIDHLQPQSKVSAYLPNYDGLHVSPPSSPTKKRGGSKSPPRPSEEENVEIIGRQPTSL